MGWGTVTLTWGGGGVGAGGRSGIVRIIITLAGGWGR